MRDISKAPVVQADLKLLEMQIAHVSTAQGCVEMASWGKPQCPVQGQVMARDERAGSAGHSLG